MLARILIFLLLSASLQAGSIQEWERFNTAFYANDLDGAMASLEQMDSDDAYLIALANYRLAGLHLARKDERGAGDHLEKALVLLEGLEESRPNDADVLGLKGGVEGMLAGTGGMIQAMRMGPRSGRTLERAMEVDPDNGTTWFMEGLGLQFRPALFGGSGEKAVEALDRAIELFHQQAGDPIRAWGLAEAYVWRGLILAGNGNLEEAEGDFVAALDIQPDYKRAAESLERIRQSGD